MTKFSYKVDLVETGCKIVVTRLADGAEKVFYQTNVKNAEEVKSIEWFMDSITDELAEGYWPRARKEKK